MARKKQRENYGDGSITPKLDKDGNQVIDKQGRPVWLICLSFGYKMIIDKNGKSRKKQNKLQRVFHGTLTEARKFKKKLSDQYENIDMSDPRERTFSDTCAAWEVSTRNTGKASEGAMNGYLLNLEHMQDKIGSKALTAITPQDVESALAEIQAERRIGNTTKHKIFAVTKRVFKYAVNHDWLVRNPCDKIEAPQIDEVTNRRSLTAEECAIFHARLDAAEEEAMAAFNEKEGRTFDYGTTFGRKCVRGLSGLSCIMALRIELATGMRRSEVLGLTWSAIDLETGQITVNQKLIIEKHRNSAEAGKLKIDKPKTKTSIRTLCVDAVTLDHLKRWKKFQAHALHLVMPEGTALTQTDKTPICIGDRGGWMRPPTISRWWEGYDQKSRKKGTEGEVRHKPGFRDEIGFPDLCMHELRHTQATQLLGNHIDLKTVQARLGHAKASFTLDLYAHAIPANDKDAAAIMGALCNTPAPNLPAPDLQTLIKSA